MRSTTLRMLGLAAVAALAACEPDRESDEVEPIPAEPRAAQPVPAHAADAPAGIAWFEGAVEQAFERARAQGKPVFLFWGAAWCPYCADLKAHVFTRRDVQERLQLFVPVYLDGDDPGAQRWGEELGVAGYPTVLALRADRTELARIAGGMDLELYDDMLDLVLGDVRPIDALLEAATHDGAALARDDCKRLAYNGWGLEDDPPPAEGIARAEALAAAAAACPADARVERARLLAVAAAYAVDAEGAADEGAQPSERLARLVGEVRDVVADRPTAAAAADALQSLDGDFFAVAKRLDPEGAEGLLADWSAVMDLATDDPRYTEGDRLAAVRSKLEAVKAFRGDIPPALADAARTRAHEALERTRGTPARPGVVNAAVNLLVTLDDFGAAYAVAEAALAESKTPYYQMADLAALEERMGNPEGAIAWLERAYRESQGAATRFQWGTNYVRGLIRMRPDDEAAVRDAAVAVLGELDGPERLYRRTRARLESLEAALRQWSEHGQHEAALAAIRGRMAEICAGMPPTEAEALARCRAFLAPATEGA
ncbi:MAG TPA: thioredoxin family protein [Gammaproteobacteria bacterium]